MTVVDTSFGEASSRTQATDPNRRETLRIRTPLPGLRGEARWLRRRTSVPRYAVECQSSNERGACPANPWGVPPPEQVRPRDQAVRAPGAASQAPGRKEASRGTR